MAFGWSNRYTYLSGPADSPVITFQKLGSSDLILSKKYLISYLLKAL